MKMPPAFSSFMLVALRGIMLFFYQNTPTAPPVKIDRTAVADRSCEHASAVFILDAFVPPGTQVIVGYVQFQRSTDHISHLVPSLNLNATHSSYIIPDQNRRPENAPSGDSIRSGAREPPSNGSSNEHRNGLDTVGLEKRSTRWASSQNWMSAGNERSESDKP